MVEITIDLYKCDGCGTCKDTCPVSVFEIVDGKSKVINLSECLVCRDVRFSVQTAPLK